ISNIDWDTVLSSVDQNADTLYSTFLSHVLPIMDYFIPYRKLIRSRTTLTSKSLRLLRISNRKYKERHSIGLQPYIDASTKFRKSVRAARRKHERALISKPNTKRFFRFASDKLKDQSSNIPALVDPSGAPLIDDQDKANLLANHFSKCYNHNLYTPPQHPPPSNGPFIDYVAFSPMIIARILRKLPNRNSTSPDDIPYVTCAFVDFSKAFDSIPLNLLIHKCETTQIRGGHRLKICPFTCNTVRFNRFFSNRIVHHWNRLDDDIVSNSS
ncbi:hypothetical protein PFISCL1PPCAC_28537, partial [Pristionchus fissidentatus]